MNTKLKSVFLFAAVLVGQAAMAEVKTVDVVTQANYDPKNFKTCVYGPTTDVPAGPIVIMGGSIGYLSKKNKKQYIILTSPKLRISTNPVYSDDKGPLPATQTVSFEASFDRDPKTECEDQTFRFTYVQ